MKDIKKFLQINLIAAIFLFGISCLNRQKTQKMSKSINILNALIQVNIDRIEGYEIFQSFHESQSRTFK